jgi:hypothetical protein
MKQGIEMTHAVEDQSALVSKERTSELGRIIEKTEGRSMRAMKTTPTASLDTGKGQWNHSFDAFSWRSLQVTYCEGGRKNKMITCHQASLVWWHVISSVGAKSYCGAIVRLRSLFTERFVESVTVNV